VDGLNRRAATTRTVSGRGSSARERSRRHGRRSAATVWDDMRRSWRAYALLLPGFALLVVFVYYPPILGLVRAFFRWQPTKTPVFVGFRNFRSYFSYPETPRELINVVKLLMFGLFANVAVPFAMAELIFSVRSRVAKERYRLLCVVPMVVPTVVTILLWSKLYDPNLGAINRAFRSVGLDFLALNWLGDPGVALYAVMGVGFPWVASVGTLVYLGGLGQITESVYDAALLDGCTGLRRAVLIDLPLVIGQVRILAILAVIGAFTSFEGILILTRGGPGYSTTVPTLTLYYRAFQTGQFGYASAIGLLLFVVAMLATVVIGRSLRSYTEEL